MAQNIKESLITVNGMWPFNNINKQRQVAIFCSSFGLMLIAFYLISPKYDLLYLVGIPLGTLGFIYFSEALTHAPI